jgi:virulence-associated protein VagC
MIVKLQQIGTSRILSVPEEIETASNEYTVKNEGAAIVFTPVKKRQNIFATPAWQKYDYQQDIANDQFLQPVKPVGQE